MGLIKILADHAGGILGAGAAALDGVIADQWLEFFYCDSIPADTLVVKGQKRVSAKAGRNKNTKGEDNIISNGSRIAVADGQCMIIVDNGKVVELCAEPGEFTWNNSTEPSIFSGGLGQGIVDSIKTVGTRFAFGGNTAKVQLVYYFNLKEITGNNFGTATPIPFRYVDGDYNIRRQVRIRCNGAYSYKIVDPIIFYTNVCGNVTEAYERSEIDTMLKPEFMSALQPAMAKLTGMRDDELIAHVTELEDALNEVLSTKWGEKRGLAVASVALNSVSMTDEDVTAIQKLQDRASMGGSADMMRGGMLDVMGDAANNSAGAMTGFLGMGMGTGMMNNMGMGGLFGGAPAGGGMAQPQGGPQGGGAPAGGAAAGAAAGGAATWKCPACGATTSGKFCQECGKPRPQEGEGWTCSKCGATNKGKFCAECGEKKPAGAPLYKCDKCGWVPPDPKNPPKFCPECGDVFDENDVQ